MASESKKCKISHEELKITLCCDTINKSVMTKYPILILNYHSYVKKSIAIKMQIRSIVVVHKQCIAGFQLPNYTSRFKHNFVV